MEKLIASLPKGSQEEVRISLSEFKGKQYVDFRVYYENDEGEWKPTKKGVALQIDNFYKFMEAMGEVETLLKENGLLAPKDKA